MLNAAPARIHPVGRCDPRRSGDPRAPLRCCIGTSDRDAASGLPPAVGSRNSSRLPKGSAA